MELLDRYIDAIARELPRRQAADITAELREDLLSKIEDKEEALGRPLTAKETEAAIVDFGHPWVVAARYRRIQHLIGPEIFPFWWATLRIVAVVAGAVWLAAMVFSVAASSSPAVTAAQRLIPGFWTLALMVFAIVTLVFVAIEHFGGRKIAARWSPRQLPQTRTIRRRRFNVATEAAMGLVFILWWTGAIHFSHLIPVPPRVFRLSMAPVWSDFYWPILACTSAELCINLLELVRPGWLRTNAVLSFAKNVAAVVIIVLLVQAGHWLDVHADGVDSFALAKAQHGLDIGMRIGLLAAAFVTACKAVYDIVRFASAWRGDCSEQPRGAQQKAA
jgi:hypothetical protein